MCDRRTGRFAAIAVAALLAGCATPQTDALLSGRDAATSRAARLDVSFQPQRTRECGPAAMAMALRWRGEDIPIDHLVDEIYTPGREGSLQSAMVAAARRHGYLAYPVRTLRGLTTHIDDGRPVIVLQNLGLSWFPQWHYAVAVGYDIGSAEIVLHSGETAWLRLGMALFERTWARGDYWAIAVTSPDRLPAGADRLVWLGEAAGLERAGRMQSARRAYLTAVAAWPGDHAALMGLGNASYALGRQANAAEAFRSAAADPVSDAARNNLAHVLSEMGRLDEAEAAAREAIALNGRYLDTARRTLAEILANRRNRGAGPPARN